MDFFVGEVTRQHDDIDMFVWAEDGTRVLGFVRVAGPSPDQQFHLTRDGEDLQIVMLEHDEQGRIITAGSGFRDSPWPARLLDGRLRRIGNLACPIVNPHVQLALQLTYTEVFPDRRLRPKDIADIERLRAALDEVPFI